MPASSLSKVNSFFDAYFVLGRSNSGALLMVALIHLPQRLRAIGLMGEHHSLVRGALGASPVGSSADVSGETLLTALENDLADASGSSTLILNFAIEALLYRVQFERNDLLVFGADL
jgi:hypothetical protein